jgi:hypothetical protein
MCEIDLRLRGLSGALVCKPSIQNNPTPSPSFLQVIDTSKCAGFQDRYGKTRGPLL